MVCRIKGTEFPHDLLLGPQSILLVIGFGRVERGSGEDFRVDRPLDPGRRLLAGGRCRIPLLLAVIEDEGGVLTGKGTLPGRVVSPEDIQECLIGNPCRIVFDPDGFAMVSQFGVCGILGGTTRITDLGTDYSLDEPEPGVWTPESPHRKGGRLRSGRCDEVDRWPNATGNRCIRFLLLHGIAPFLRDRALGASLRLRG
jgi:hypothetical protein